MTQNEAPNRPQQKYQFIEKDTGYLSSYGLRVLEQIWRQVAANFGPVSCSSVHTGNKYLLTPLLQSEGGASYGDHMGWNFVADFTSTGAVTAAVVGESELATIKVYTSPGAVQAAAGDIVINGFYVVYYNSGLDGGLGGFVLK